MLQYFSARCGYTIHRKYLNTVCDRQELVSAHGRIIGHVLHVVAGILSTDALASDHLLWAWHLPLRKLKHHVIFAYFYSNSTKNAIIDSPREV